MLNPNKKNIDLQTLMLRPQDIILIAAPKLSSAKPSFLTNPLQPVTPDVLDKIWSLMEPKPEIGCSKLETIWSFFKSKPAAKWQKKIISELDLNCYDFSDLFKASSQNQSTKNFVKEAIDLATGIVLQMDDLEELSQLAAQLSQSGSKIFPPIFLAKEKINIDFHFHIQEIKKYLDKTENALASYSQRRNPLSKQAETTQLLSKVNALQNYMQEANLIQAKELKPVVEKLNEIETLLKPMDIVKEIDIKEPITSFNKAIELINNLNSILISHQLKPLNIQVLQKIEASLNLLFNDASVNASKIDKRFLFLDS